LIDRERERERERERDVTMSVSSSMRRKDFRERNSERFGEIRRDSARLSEDLRDFW